MAEASALDTKNADGRSSATTEEDTDLTEHSTSKTDGIKPTTTHCETIERTTTEDDWHTVLTLRKRRGRQVPGILVASDLRKAFDSVTHEALISAVEEARPGIRIVNIVKWFLEHLTFEIRSDNTCPRTFANNAGVPQGAILSPMLFNLVMRGLAVRLRQVQVTLWTEPGGPLKTTEIATKTVQHARGTLTDYLKETDMQLSPEKKTKYILPDGTAQEKEKVELYLAGQKLERAPQRHVKILGTPIQEDGAAATWLKQLELT
ncbi:hypothetical protein HPB49_002895 [Dermacentor silvarum]|uniref:Uncharacterized protein n=1 Tax=Dermacentor silvarum TaxID=543639 RepID=A0ACB8D2H7_DERSI|nr:hypothetical protein HPB49_002895 [Dermacentor silvarum]